MKRYHGVSPLEQKRSMPAWLARPSFVVGLVIVLLVVVIVLLVLVMIWVYRKPVKNYGKPKSRR